MYCSYTTAWVSSGVSMLRAGAVGLEAHDDLVAAVAQVLRLRVSLAAVAQDGDGFSLQGLGISVMLVENSSHRRAPLVALVAFHKGGKMPLLLGTDSKGNPVAYRPVGRLLRKCYLRSGP